MQYTPTPPVRYLVEIWENLLFHVLYGDTCKCAINLFPITWGPFEYVNLLYFLLKIQIWNGCNVLNIAGNPIKDININLSFLSSTWTVVEWTPHPPDIGKIFNFISEFRIKSCAKSPPAGYLVEIWENLLFHVLYGDTCKCAINLFPITWGPFEYVNLLYVLLKIQIWNGCNVLNTARNPIKDINVNLSFLSSRWKVVEFMPTRKYRNPMVGHVFWGPSKLGMKDLLPMRVTILLVFCNKAQKVLSFCKTSWDLTYISLNQYHKHFCYLSKHMCYHYLVLKILNLLWMKK